MTLIIDGIGNIYITGVQRQLETWRGKVIVVVQTGSFWEHATAGTNIFVISHNDGGAASFVAKVDGNGHFLWARMLTSFGDVSAGGIAVNMEGDSFG